MKLLVDIHDQAWLSNQNFLDVVGDSIAPEHILFYPEIGDACNVGMLACDRLRPGLVWQLPRLELIQKLGAGVDTMIFDPALPDDVRITRLKTAETALEMARYCLAYVLQDVHNLGFHRENQALNQWIAKEPGEASKINVGVLGLGHIGSAIAILCAQAGFNVSGWSRTPKNLENVSCQHGDNALPGVLGNNDFLICILPATPETKGFFNLDRLQMMKPGSTLINVGRGSLVIEDDLLTALESGRPGYAVLDVFQSEPLATDHPFWQHPGVTITPHVSGWHLQDGMSVIADNYHRLVQNQPLLNEVDRSHGY